MPEPVDPALEFESETLMQSVSGARVILWEPAAGEFHSLELRQKAQLLAYMELWADGRRMGEKQFNGSEGRVKSTNRMLQAFKIHKIRGYGIVLPLKGKKTFALVDWDVAKKDNKAKPRVLERARDRAAAFETKFGK